MNTRDDSDVWVINIVKLLIAKGGILPFGEINQWVKTQCQKQKMKMPNMKAKIHSNTPRYFLVSNEQRIDQSYVTVNTPVTLCTTNWTPGRCTSHCGKIHICKYFIIGNCRNNPCKFGHSFKEHQNMLIIENNGLWFLSEEELKKLWMKEVNIPEVCKYYNNEGGCSRRGKAPCPALHLCRYFLLGQCKFENCKRSHDVTEKQPMGVLGRLGWDIQRHPKDILQELCRAMTRGSSAGSDEKVQCSDSATQGGKWRPESARPRSAIEAGPRIQRVEPTRMRTANRDKSEQADDPGLNVIKICVYQLTGKCSYGKQCKNRHYKKPYLWEYSDTLKGQESWQAFQDGDNESIELCFADVTEDCCHATLTDCTTIVQIDFDRMTYQGGSVAGKVRRVGTDSWGEVPITRPFVTRWLWYWKDENNIWNLYGTQEKEHSRSEVSSREIEEKFIEKEDLVFQAGIHKYEIKFEDMCQLNIKYKTTRQVRRRPECGATKKPVTAASEAMAKKSEEIAFPKSWDIGASSTDSEYQLVEVKPSGRTKVEWDEIAGLFAKSSVTVKKISRIQNYNLWEDFSRWPNFNGWSNYEKAVCIGSKCDGPELVKNVIRDDMKPDTSPTLRQKSRMQKSIKTDDKTVPELQLFHGTKDNVVMAICQQGFDWRLNGTSVGTLYGKGSYFARDAKYSLDYTNSNKLFVARVLVGKYTTGKATYVRPPPTDPSNPHRNFYDACVDNVNDPKIYVVFEKAQSYPEYIIEV